MNERPSAIVDWLVHNVRNYSTAAALSRSEAIEAVNILSDEYGIECTIQYNGQGRFVINITKEDTEI
jgi:hypothetical protein